MFPGLDLYYTDGAHHLRTAGKDLDDIDRDLSDEWDIPHTFRTRYCTGTYDTYQYVVRKN